MIGAGNKTKSSTGGQLIRMESPLRTVISSLVVALLPAPTELGGRLGLEASHGEGGE